jgi:hypothetical protein
VGSAAGGFLLGSGWWSQQAVAAVAADTGTIARGFVVNGRHLAFGDDPTSVMWAGGQLFNLNPCNAVPPTSVRVWVDYGRDRFYGHTAEAEIRELLTHVPVWDGRPGALQASSTLNADQFFVHAEMAGRETGVTAEAPTAGSEPSWPRCSPSTRSTWPSRVTTTSTSGRTR